MLLALDGDSLAHRAYHGGPKNIRNNAISGFANWLAQLWQAEAPDAIVVGWDTLTVPTYRHEAFQPYQSGREFDQALLEQLELLPEVVRAAGFTAAKADGSPLPEWLAFDTSTMSFTGQAPAGFSGRVAIMLTAVDGSGAQAATQMTLLFEAKN